jgi:hypothetical protein
VDRAPSLADDRGPGHEPLVSFRRRNALRLRSS